jgi:hypothetical protein
LNDPIQPSITSGRDWRRQIFTEASTDGIELLPNHPGVYLILNTANGLRYVGCASRSIKRRALSHRNELRRCVPSNMLMRRDVKKHGVEAFIFLALETPPILDGVRGLHQLGRLETDWVTRMRSHDEQCGYNSESGHIRTPSALLRDTERRQLGLPRGYRLLPGVDLYDPIAPILSESWMRGR